MKAEDTPEWGPLWKQVIDKEKKRLIFTSLGSGSSGNCYLITNGGESLIIDAGIGIRKTLKAIATLPYDLGSKPIRAIFVTHDHADHTRAVVPLAYKLQVPIYASPLVARALRLHRYASDDINAYLRVMPVGSSVQIGDMSLSSFEVPHDATHNVGYQIKTDQNCLSIITDIGHITEEITRVIEESNHLVFESNYDETMLATGRYPDYLKERIRSGIGHISNRLAAEAITMHYHSKLRSIILCHLSQDNNHPQLARTTLTNMLETELGNLPSSLRIEVLPRTETTIFTLS